MPEATEKKDGAMPDENTNTPDPKGTDSNTPPSTPDPDADLGPAGIKALQTERAAREKAEKAARDAQAALDKIKQSTQTEQEKAIEQAKNEGRSEATSALVDKLTRTEIRVAASGKLADPDDAPAFLGDLSRFVGKDGEVDTKAITSAIDDLLKAKPYLAAKGRAGSLPGGGKNPPAGVSINDDIRARMRRGN